MQTSVSSKTSTFHANGDVWTYFWVAWHLIQIKSKSSIQFPVSKIKFSNQTWNIHNLFETRFRSKLKPIFASILHALKVKKFHSTDYISQSQNFFMTVTTIFGKGMVEIILSQDFFLNLKPTTFVYVTNFHQLTIM